jgi:hypothetical protein
MNIAVSFDFMQLPHAVSATCDRSELRVQPRAPSTTSADHDANLEIIAEHAAAITVRGPFMPAVARFTTAAQLESP